MTEKRFFQDGNEILTWIRDKETWEKLKTDADVINKLNELDEEVMNLRAENTQFKLIVGEIIKDMQKYIDDDQMVYINQSYVDWINKEVDTTLYSQKGDDLND